MKLRLGVKCFFFTKKKEELIEKETNIGATLSDDEIKQYIDEVVNEIKKNRGNDGI